MKNRYSKRFQLLLAIVLLSGCGMFRKVYKSTEYSKGEIRSTEKRTLKDWSSDQSIITIREKSDTLIMVPAQIIEQETPFILDSLFNGLHIIKSDFVDVKLRLQPETGILSATATLNARSLPVKFDKETIVKNDKVRKIRQSESSGRISKSEQSSAIVQKSPVAVWPYLLGAGILVMIGFSMFYWLKRYY
ncbi:hypothetical protein [Pedobacter caeni]|uniref:Lipoprotein n=1 Tax=Pedobacter caeni TaxID=288992 RepID=A0A1M5GWA7_9SPHI|nr:hypothetical protein [Pedobacter caeni]SHG07947.1 hypothetical protein SAMN04488522_104395 [Pedobacter caeni]